MKNFVKNVIIKKFLVVMITIIMVSNFIMPNYVCAVSVGEAIGAIASGAFYLLAKIGDIGIELMQNIMVRCRWWYKKVYSRWRV